MDLLSNAKEFLFTCCILLSCFLTDLTVEVSSINYLQHFGFNQLEKKLYSKGNDIETISSDAFKNVTNCQLFEITNSEQLSTLPENLFQEGKAFSNLKHISIVTTGITTLPEHLLLDLTQLEYFEIYDTKLETIPANLFQSNRKLKVVAISGNKLLKSIPNGLLKYSTELYAIWINHNVLLNTLPSQIFPTSFKNSHTLLTLYDNSLKYIEYETFSIVDFSKINQLNLNNNYLVCLPDYFLNVTRIPKNRRKNINLTGNCFDEFSEICKLYECKNRPVEQCEDAKSSANMERCQQGYDWKNTNRSRDTNYKVKYDPTAASLTAFYVLVPCVFLVLLGISFYFLYKRQNSLPTLESTINPENIYDYDKYYK